MKILSQIKIAATGLRTHKGRSFLTILGIVIGITAIILVIAIGRGAQSLILGEVQGLGSTTMIVIPGREPSGPSDPSGIVETIMSDSLKDRELRALSEKTNAPGIKKIIPVVFGSETALYESETFRPTIIGGGAGIMDVFGKEPEAGRVFTEDEVKSNAAVVIIGSRVEDELFGQSSALNKRIKIKNKNFQVIGVLGEMGQSSLFDFDKSIITPVSTAQFYLFGIRYFNRLIVEAESEELIPQIKEDIERTLRNMHGITNPDKDDFFIVTQTEIIDTISNITNALTLLLASIAAISLVVGGVGIMNIMLVSVTERTREIGLRKAIGATETNIMTQFLFEAIILTIVGGIVGILIGATFNYGITLLIRKFEGFNWAYVFPVFAAFIGVAVAAAIGLIFGLYPAMQAAKKSPIEALRYE
jgi:putative ABC transport system permease protein